MIKEVLLLEYEKIKDEQRVRISIRENLFYIALIVIGAVFSSLLTISSFDFGYLVLPPLLFIVSTSYYYNDEIVAKINAYIRENLTPRLAEAANLSPEDIFQWEGYTRNMQRTRRRIYQLATNLTLYPGASGTSLAFFVSRRTELSQAEQLAIVICGLITGLMAMQVLYYADLFSRRPQ